jgi:hypothetical protein
MSGRAVIALKPHDNSAGKIFFEAKDIVDFRATPAIDRLIIIADASDILSALRNQT